MLLRIWAQVHEEFLNARESTPMTAVDEGRPTTRQRGPRAELPLVYSCSGCSSAAQMTNWLAIALDRSGRAEMSCIAGVGGDVPSLVRKATSGRPVIAIDGCALECARSCLARHDVVPDVHHRLSNAGVRKKFGEDFDADQALDVLDELLTRLDEELPLSEPRAPHRRTELAEQRPVERLAAPPIAQWPGQEPSTRSR
jgi:uncharacterized metal-binding protein